MASDRHVNALRQVEARLGEARAILDSELRGMLLYEAATHQCARALQDIDCAVGVLRGVRAGYDSASAESDSCATGSESGTICARGGIGCPKTHGPIRG